MQRFCVGWTSRTSWFAAGNESLCSRESATIGADSYNLVSMTRIAAEMLGLLYRANGTLANELRIKATLPLARAWMSELCKRFLSGSLPFLAAQTGGAHHQVIAFREAGRFLGCRQIAGARSVGIV